MKPTTAGCAKVRNKHPLKTEKSFSLVLEIELKTFKLSLPPAVCFLGFCLALFCFSFEMESE